LRARLEELNTIQLEELSTAKQEAADLRDKLRQLREESNIVQNDRLEADIKLAAQVESLEQLKAEMEAQITQLNESLFREEQERNQRISEVKQELVAKYEA
jgi:predicted  nucleic acid-binding Zn-ribbon protein